LCVKAGCFPTKTPAFVYLGINQTVEKKRAVIKILALQFYLHPALWNSLKSGEERRGEERGMGEVQTERRERKEERTVRC